MADNYNYDETGSRVMAGDDIGGVLHPRVKVSLGADGAATDCPGDGSNGMDVDVTRVQGTVTTQDTASKVDDAAFTPATDRVLMVGAQLDNTTPDSVDEGDAGALRMSANRSLHTQIRDAAGNERGANVTAGNALVVDGSAVTQPVSDGGGTLTVDGTVTAQLAAGTNTNEVVGDVAQDVAVAGNPVLIGGRASDAVPTAMSADGDAVYPWLDRRGATKAALVDDAGDSCMDGANNAVRVNIIAGAGSGGTAMTDDAAFTPGTTSVTPVAGTYRTTRDLLNDNDAGAIAITERRAVLTCIETPAGDSAMDETNDALRVNIVAGAGSGGTAMTDDAAFTPGTTSITPMGAMADETAPDSVNEGDAGVLRMSLNRNLYTSIRDAAGNERGVNVTAGNALTVDGSAVTQPVSAASLPLPTGAATAANQLPDGHNVTVDNAGGGAAVNVQDGGNSLTVDGTVGISGTVTTAPTAQKTDDAAFAPGTDQVMMIGAEFDDTTPDSVNEGDAGAVRMSANRNLYSTLRDAAGNERGANVTAGNALVVDGSAVTQPISGTVTANAGTGPFPVSDNGGSLTVDGSVTVSGTVTANAGTGTMTTAPTAQKTDDAAFTPGTDPVLMIGAEFDDTTPDSVNEGDAGAIRMSANRNLYTTLRDAAGNERGANINASNQLSVSVDNTPAVTISSLPNEGQQTMANSISVAVASDQSTLAVGGTVAHDAADSGNPQKIGAKAIAHGTNPTAVAANDRTDLYANRAGVQFVIGGHPNVVTTRVNYTAAQTDTAIVTVGAGLKIVVTRILVAVSNATTTSPSVLIGFGTTTTPTGAGVVADHPGIPAGGGFNTGDGSGILGVGADNEDLRITSSVPTTGSLSVTVSYYTIES